MFMTDENVQQPFPNYVQNCTVNYIRSFPVDRGSLVAESMQWESNSTAITPFVSSWPGVWSFRSVSGTDIGANVWVVWGFDGYAWTGGPLLS